MASVNAMKIRQLSVEEPKAEDDDKPKPVAWLKETLPACPTDENRTIMDDGKTHIVKFPYVGAVCQAQIANVMDAVNLNEEAQSKH